MRFLLDASVHRGLLPHLQNLGHGVKTVGIDYPRDLADPDILVAAHNESRVLITADRDFGELVYYRRGEHAGVIFLRLRNAGFDVIQERIDYVLKTRSDPIEDFLVVTPNSVRTRRGQS